MPGGGNHTRFPTPDHLMRIGKRKLPKPKARDAAPFQGGMVSWLKTVFFSR